MAPKRKAVSAVAKRSSVSKKSVKAKAKSARARALPKVAAKAATKRNKKRRELTIGERHEIIINHMDSSRRLAWSFLNKWRVRLEEDEVVSIAGTALCEAAHRFDPNFNVSFGTFFFYHLRGLLLKEIAQRVEDSKIFHRTDDGSQSELTPLSMTTGAATAAAFHDNDTPEELVERQERSKICWEACSKLDPLEQDVVIRFFVNEQSVVDIAKELGYCRCHISRVKSRALAILSKHLRGLADDGAELADGIEVEAGDFEARSHRDTSSAKPRSYRGGRGRRKSGALVKPVFGKRTAERSDAVN